MLLFLIVKLVHFRHFLSVIHHFHHVNELPINLGATFNMTLVYRMCDVISSEACAFNNAGRVGLNLFTTNINIFRDPRWGRGQETVGEDPYIGSQYDYAYVTDFQGGHDERYMKVAGNCKHYVA